jgi:GNAT superfamily N-acetyltransferase
MLSPELRAFAEAPDRYTRIGPDVERYADARVCIIQGPTWAGVSDVHVAGDEVEALVEEVRERVPAEKRAVWWLGPSTEPADLHARLEALGFVEPDDRAPLLHALACTTPPPPAPGIEVRRVESFDEFVVATNVMWTGFGTAQEKREQDRPHLRTMYEGMRASGVPATFLAYVDGEPVGIGRSVYSPRGVFLIAGAVVPEARGRGVYRALVRARWDDAVERGTPAMITEAIPDTSYPVLKRIGFVDVCTIRRLAPPA